MRIPPKPKRFLTAADYVAAKDDAKRQALAKPLKCPVCCETLKPHPTAEEPSCYVHGDYRLENARWAWYSLNERY